MNYITFFHIANWLYGLFLHCFNWLRFFFPFLIQKVDFMFLFFRFRFFLSICVLCIHQTIWHRSKLKEGMKIEYESVFGYLFCFLYGILFYTVLCVLLRVFFFRRFQFVCFCCYCCWFVKSSVCMWFGYWKYCTATRFLYKIKYTIFWLPSWNWTDDSLSFFSFNRINMAIDLFRWYEL